MNLSPYGESQLAEAEEAFALKQGYPLGHLTNLWNIRRRMDVSDLPDSCKLAVWVVAPVLAGFVSWLAAEIKESCMLPLGVMREGRYLLRLLSCLHGVQGREIAVNRNLSLLAAYAADDDEALVNWLVRTRIKPLTGGDLAKFSLSTKGDVPVDGIIDLDLARTLVAKWGRQGEESPLWYAAKTARDGLTLHWKRTTEDAPNKGFVMLDFASAGNIQRSLQTVLEGENYPPVLRGLNFATTQGVIWAQQKGCEIRGFLSDAGQPSWIGDAYRRTPELIEIFAGCDLGPLQSYGSDGQPQWSDSPLDKNRQRTLSDWQEHILAAARIYHDAMSSALTADLCRCLWGRLLLQPLANEVLALCDWPLDFGVDGETPRLLAPSLAGLPQAWSKIQTAWPAASLLRQNIS